MPNGGGVQIPDKMFPVTEAPASRQIRAAARSNPMPGARSVPDLGQAALWSPMGLLALAPTAGWHQRQWQGCMVVLGTRGRPQGRKARRDVGGGVPGWCSGSVPRGGVLPSLLVWVVGSCRTKLLQRVLAPRGCGGLTIVLWMLAQLPIGRCAGQSDCEPGQ